MRRVLFVAIAVVGLASLAGCPAKPKNGECKTSQDCLEQQGFGKVCVEGRCQECAADADCKEGFVCRTNKCVPKPQCGKDADCPQGQRCENERCVAPREDPDAEARRRAAAEAEAAKRAVPPECADAGAFVIRFAFDQSVLVPESQATLQRLADCLKRAPAKRMTIAGNCDERGTTQYNIALGARRAEAARKYLSDLGVATTMDTVSYGEEKPLCTESTEACWARNRRDEFQVER
jgi:peptidoglycan-associated lipoprotein